MQIHEEIFGLTPWYWHRITDGCQGEFKSLKTTLRLGAAPTSVLGLSSDDSDFLITWNYYESHEGKSRSDGIGAVIKNSIERGIRKRPGTILTKASEAIEVVQTEIRESREQESFTIHQNI